MESMVNAAESFTNIDFDGDGDIGRPGALQRADSSFINPGQVGGIELGGDDRTVSFTQRPSQIGGFEKPSESVDAFSALEMRLASLKEAGAALEEEIDGYPRRGSIRNTVRGSVDSSYRPSFDEIGDDGPKPFRAGKGPTTVPEEGEEEGFIDAFYALHPRTVGDDDHSETKGDLPPPPRLLRTQSSFQRAKNLSCLDK